MVARVDGQTPTQLPPWFIDEHSNEPLEVVSFAEAIRDLPQAVETTVAYKNPYSGTGIETDRFTALVEPSRLVAHAPADNDVEPLFDIPSDSYTINPLDIYGPLEDVLQEHEVDGRPLGEVVFGEIRQ